MTPTFGAVPEFIVECLSPANRKGPVRDLLADYARIGVPEVWLLDPSVRDCACYRHTAGKLERALTLRTGQISPQFAPEASIDIEPLWLAFHR